MKRMRTVVQDESQWKGEWTYGLAEEEDVRIIWAPATTLNALGRIVPSIWKS